LAGVFVPLKNVFAAKANFSMRQLVVQKEHDYPRDLDSQVWRMNEFARRHFHHSLGKLGPIFEVIDLGVLINNLSVSLIE
jgi:hypothetical protein